MNCFIHRVLQNLTLEKSKLRSAATETRDCPAHPAAKRRRGKKLLPPPEPMPPSFFFFLLLPCQSPMQAGFYNYILFPTAPLNSLCLIIVCSNLQV